MVPRPVRIVAARVWLPAWCYSAKACALAGRPSRLSGSVQSPGGMVTCGAVVVLAELQVAQAQPHDGLTSEIAVGLGGGATDLGTGHPFDGVTVAPQIPAQPVGQVPSDGPRAMFSGILDGGDQIGALGVQPVERRGC